MDKQHAQNILNDIVSKYLTSGMNLMPFVASTDKSDWDILVDTLVAVGMAKAAMAVHNATITKFKYPDGTDVEDMD